MARLPAVLKILEEADARPDPPSWKILAREARKAGKLGETKRGIGASSVTISEAAYLLLAGMVSERPAHGPELADRYARLKRKPPRGEPPAVLLGPVFRHRTFSQALEALIMQSEQLRETVTSTGGWLELTATGPAPLRVLLRWFAGTEATFEVEWSSLGSAARPPVSAARDLFVTRKATITEKTIIALGTALAQ